VRRLPETFDLTDPNEAYAASLLAHVEPLRSSPMRKRRVWVALERSARRRPKNRVSVAVVVGLVLCGTTAASATMTHFWKRLYGGSAEVPMAPTAVVRPTEPSQAMPPPVIVQHDMRQAESPRVAPKPVPSNSRVAVAEPADPASAALMVEAMHARRAGTLARVRELSAEYRLKYPDGALHEEALALSIEAAAALGEEEASRLSAMYLQRYPRGRFRGQAQRALGSTR
jgi:hypothetical protein